MDKREFEVPRCEKGKCCEGYTLYCVPTRGALHNQNATLVDMNGQIVHEWSITGTPAMMLPGGALMGNMSTLPHWEESQKELTSAGPRQQLGPVEFVREGWDGQLEWSFNNWDDAGTGMMMSRQHHDYQIEGNPVGFYAPGQEFIDKGKILILGLKNKLVPEISETGLMDDVVYEIDCSGNLTGYEWHAADHFNELGFDSSAKEAISKNPGNLRDTGEFRDWLHINSMALLGENHWYDETGDERFNPSNFIIGSRQANFVAIVNRATGKIVWRIGPDFMEGKPEYNLGQIAGQHHAHMIPRNLTGEGNIMVFDNGGASGYGGPTAYPRYTRDYSRVIEFNPVTLEMVWQYGAEDGAENFYSFHISSAQRLPNGNTLITDGSNGRVFEVTPDKEIVWEFLCPYVKEGVRSEIYRAYRTPPEWVPGNPAGYDYWAALYE